MCRTISCSGPATFWMNTLNVKHPSSKCWVSMSSDYHLISCFNCIHAVGRVICGCSLVLFSFMFFYLSITVNHLRCVSVILLSLFLRVIFFKYPLRSMIHVTQVSWTVVITLSLPLALAIWRPRRVCTTEPSWTGFREDTAREWWACCLPSHPP